MPGMRERIEILIKERDELKLSLDFYKVRIELIEKIKHNFPEPLLTAICDILANRNLRPELKYLLKDLISL